MVVGFDRHINYHKIQYATLCIRENPGCLFLATNLDAVTHLTDAQEWAGNGSMVGAIRGVCSDWSVDLLVFLLIVLLFLLLIVLLFLFFCCLAVVFVTIPPGNNTPLHPPTPPPQPPHIHPQTGSTKREPTVVGKPSDFMLDNIAKSNGLRRDQICMVGDRLDTDIMFGKNGGLATMLVLSGVTTKEELLSESNTIRPDLFTGQLPDMLQLRESSVPA